jgi:NAD(P)-dependent dehydrogenase (short-subunit alcohol dehydrogenase family)
VRKSCLDLTGRVAVVLGGTSGLGKSIAIGLAEHGADVIPGGRRADLLAETCRAVEGCGRRTLNQRVDVTDRVSIAQFKDRVLEAFGRVDVLVNAAGTTLKKPTIDITGDEWEGLFRVNLTGVLHACQEFYPSLKESGAGRVINIASLSSSLAFHQVATYSATKAGVLSLTKSLACEWAKDGICVNAIAPGVFPTELNTHLLRGTKRGEEMLLRTPMGRFGEAHEVVGAAVLLASDGASFITGHSLAVDGGYLASGVNS